MRRSQGKKEHDEPGKVSRLVVREDAQLLDWLMATFADKARNKIKAVLRDGQVEVEGRPVRQFDHQLESGQMVCVQWQRVTQNEKLAHGIELVHEDEDLIVINKPAGLLTVATDKEKRRTAFAALSEYVKKSDPDNKIFIIHRLDRDTSGLLMFAKNEEVKELVQKSWEATIAERTYVAILEGVPTKDEGTLTSWLTESKAFIVYSSQNPKLGRKSITHYKQLRSNREFTLVELRLETGRKHQIRVHMQDLGCPVAGDKKYGALTNPMRRMALHARVLAFNHPRSGQLVRYETPIPRAFTGIFGKGGRKEKAGDRK